MLHIIKKHFLVLTTLLLVFIFFANFMLNLAGKKKEYQSRIEDNIQVFLQQQTDNLQRLGSNLLPFVRDKNYAQISTYLAAYEDAIYGLAKQGETISGNVQLVSLNIPLLIVGSKGLLNTTAMMPDQEYYNAGINDPFNLVVSKNYHKSEMPDYTFFNLGIGVVDNLQIYYGHLEQKIALDRLYAYLSNKLNNETLFNFNLQNHNGLHAIVTLNKFNCWLACGSYILQRLLFVLTTLWLLRSGYKFYYQYISNIKTLAHTNEQLLNVHSQLQAITQANILQSKYGSMCLNQAKQNVNVLQLLQDALAINIPTAQQQVITMPTITDELSNLYVYAARYQLLRLLSGIVAEILYALQPHAKLEINVATIKIGNSQQLEVCFTDNGYYHDLEDRKIIEDTTDIRCQGWGNIKKLAMEIGAELEYKHQIYNGNKISVKFMLEAANNILAFKHEAKI
jgi:hypothetical protein